MARATEVLEQLKALVHRQGSLEADQFWHILSDLAGQTPGAAPAIEVLNAGARSCPARPDKPATYKPSRSTTLFFARARPAPARPTWPWPWPWRALKQERIRKIVLVRPAVEAGESLGFLPGDLQAKINPYLRPLLDALREMMDFDQIRRYTDQDLIEVIPLAYMRGRTLNDAFIILDEAQNTTSRK